AASHAREPSRRTTDGSVQVEARDRRAGRLSVAEAARADADPEGSDTSETSGAAASSGPAATHGRAASQRIASACWREPDPRWGRDCPEPREAHLAHGSSDGGCI